MNSKADSDERNKQLKSGLKFFSVSERRSTAGEKATAVKWSVLCARTKSSQLTRDKSACELLCQSLEVTVKMNGAQNGMKEAVWLNHDPKHCNHPRVACIHPDPFF